MAEYKQRNLEDSLLSKIVKEYYPSFSSTHHRYPAHVYKAFEAFLDCGDLTKGFMRTKCSQCDKELIVAFSCKKRGFCSSCGAKRAAESSLHLVDNILPVTKYRQMVLTLPFPLRFWCATNKSLLNKIYKIAIEAILKKLRDKALKVGAKNPTSGAITYIQNWGSSLSLNPHFHILMMESYFEQQEDNPPKLRNLSEWNKSDHEHVLGEIIKKSVRHLTRKGYLNAEGEIVESPLYDPLFKEHPDLVDSLAASLQNRIAFGEYAGRYVTRIGSGFGYKEEVAVTKSKLCITQNGFSLHGGRLIKPMDRIGLEQMIGYMARPSIATKRLSITNHGNIRYELKTKWSDGTTAIEFTPMDFLSRLAALVPPPRVHMIKHSGIFAPNHPLRKSIILKPDQKKGFQNRCEQNDDEKRKVKNSSWAKLLSRIFNIDVGICSKCGGEMEIISAIFDPFQVHRYLSHVGLARSPPNEPTFDEATITYLPLEA